MQKATIYTETTIKGPTVKDGAYAAEIEYIRKNGEPETREVLGTEENTTYNRTTLLAIVTALKRFNRPCEIEIVTSNSFIKNTVECGNLSKWQENEWKTSKGEDIKNKELWQEFAQESKKHKIVVTLWKSHAYSGILKMKMEGFYEKKM